MLHIYTYSTAPEKVQFLEQSAKLHTLTITNLSKTQTWTGFQDRIDSIKEVLTTLPDTDIFCFVDAYDILVNANEKEILDTFLTINKPLIFGGEINMYPVTLDKEKYPKSSSPFRFLNAGCFIGYVKQVKELYLWAYEKYKKKIISGEEDQELYQTYFLENQDKVIIDYDTNIVLNMYHVHWQTLQIINGKIQYIPSEKTPCFLHFNGMSYMDVMNDFIHTDEHTLSFDYNNVYSRTFLALIGAKILSEHSPLRIQLTSNGHSYPNN